MRSCAAPNCSNGTTREAAIEARRAGRDLARARRGRRGGTAPASRHRRSAGRARRGRHRHRCFGDRGLARRSWTGRPKPMPRRSTSLSTAVAIFDRRKRLVFHNSAYRQLWSLPPSLPRRMPVGFRNPRPAARRPASARTGRFPRLEGKRPLPPIRRWRRPSRSGICPTGGRCASSSIPIRRAASPISSTTSPNASISNRALTR